MLFLPSNQASQRNPRTQHQGDFYFYFENKCFQKRITTEDSDHQSWLDSAERNKNSGLHVQIAVVLLLCSSYCDTPVILSRSLFLFLCISNLFFSYPVEKIKRNLLNCLVFCFSHTFDLSVWYYYQRPCSVQMCRVAPQWWRCCALLSACSCTGCAAHIMCYDSRESSVFCSDNTQSVHMWDRWGPVWPWLIKVVLFHEVSAVWLPLGVRPASLTPRGLLISFIQVDQMTTDWMREL